MSPIAGLLQSLEGERLEQSRWLRLELEQAMRPTLDLFADVQARMKVFSDSFTRPPQELITDLSAGLRLHLQEAEQLRRSTIAALLPLPPKPARLYLQEVAQLRPSSSRLESLARLVTPPGLFEFDMPELPPVVVPARIAKLEQRVAELEAALRALLTPPPEPPKEVDDNRKSPGQYL